MPKFEDGMKRLEEIVESLEKGDLDIDKSLKLFEEGLDLSKKLQKELKGYEEKIAGLMQDDEESTEL